MLINAQERERERERKTERELTLNGDFLNSQRLVLASLHKDIPMGCKDFVLPEPFWKTTMLTVLSSTETRDISTMTTSVRFELLLYICMATTNWKRRLQKFSLFSSSTARKQISQSLKAFTWTTIQKLKTCCRSKFSNMILIPLTENSLVTRLVEVLKKRQKCQAFTLQQSHLLRQQHKRVVQSFPMQ